MVYTRRDFGKAHAGWPAGGGLLLGSETTLGMALQKPNSKWAGVQVGMNVPYNFGTGNFTPGDAIIAEMCPARRQRRGIARAASRAVSRIAGRLAGAAAAARARSRRRRRRKVRAPTPRRDRHGLTAAGAPPPLVRRPPRGGWADRAAAAAVGRH